MKQQVKFSLMIILVGAAALSLTSCSGSDGEQYVVECLNTADDSQATANPTVFNLIDSAANGSPTYHTFSGPRQSLSAGIPTLDYMVHEPVGTPKNTLLVLIAGGQLNAGITGTGDGSSVLTAGSNFLVRSAHLFAMQGYRVLTIDRPLDYSDFLDPPASTDGYALDGYRTAVHHAVDLSAMINRVNTSHQPVILVGTSRGAISAVAQHSLAAAIAISSPVTSGSNGDPVSRDDASLVPSPAHVLWHINDGCSVTSPTDSKLLEIVFPDGKGTAVKGGFEPGTDLCGPESHHGFLGIESCAVSNTSAWLVDKLKNLPTSRPIANPVTAATTINTVKTDIDLNGAASGSSSLIYSLPFTNTSLAGTVTLNPATNLVTYTPPTDVSGITDTFVYVVTEAEGGTSHNIVSVTINP